MVNILCQNVKSAFCLKSQTKYCVLNLGRSVLPSFLPPSLPLLPSLPPSLSLSTSLHSLRSIERFCMIVLFLRLRSSSNVLLSIRLTIMLKIDP